MFCLMLRGFVGKSKKHFFICLNCKANQSHMNNYEFELILLKKVENLTVMTTTSILTTHNSRCVYYQGTVMQSAWHLASEYFLVKDYWGCAAGWGRIFTTRLTIMGLHF